MRDQWSNDRRRATNDPPPPTPSPRLYFLVALSAIAVEQVAKALNADMILVANGGLGSAYDELELNRGICEKYGINVRGVVLNKVCRVACLFTFCTRVCVCVLCIFLL